MTALDLELKELRNRLNFEIKDMDVKISKSGKTECL